MSAPTRDEVIRLMAEIGKEYSQLIDEIGGLIFLIR